MADTDDPFAKYQGYKRLHDEQNATLAGENTPDASQREAAEARRKAQEAAAQGFSQVGPGRRLMAGARQVVGGMPLIRHIPGISGFANPEAGTDAANDLAMYREGQPGSARIARFMGSAVPFLGAAGVAPRIMSTLPGAATVSGGIEGTDAYLAGENPVTAAMAGAAGVIPGTIAGRVITPRNRDASTAMWRAYNDVLADAQSSSLSAVARAMGGVSGRDARGRFTTRMTREQADEVITRAHADLHNARHPSPQIPNIGADQSRGVERALRGLGQQITIGALGAGFGAHHGVNPMWTAAGAMMAPHIARWGVNTANRSIDSINRGLLSGNMPRYARSAAFRGLNNQILSDEMRALLMALSSPTAQEFTPDAMSALGLAPPAPTLGGNQNAAQ